MRVVRRSAALLQYGESFTYVERFRARGALSQENLLCSDPLRGLFAGAIAAWLTFLVSSIGLLLMYFRLTRSIMDRFIPQPGQGIASVDVFV
jgi:hypothetical protein